MEQRNYWKPGAGPGEKIRAVSSPTGGKINDPGAGYSPAPRLLKSESQIDAELDAEASRLRRLRAAQDASCAVRVSEPTASKIDALITEGRRFQARVGARGGFVDFGSAVKHRRVGAW